MKVYDILEIPLAQRRRMYGEWKTIKSAIAYYIGNRKFHFNHLYSL